MADIELNTLSECGRVAIIIAQIQALDAQVSQIYEGLMIGLSRWSDDICQIKLESATNEFLEGIYNSAVLYVQHAHNYKCQIIYLISHDVPELLDANITKDMQLTWIQIYLNHIVDLLQMLLSSRAYVNDMLLSSYNDIKTIKQMELDYINANSDVKKYHQNLITFTLYELSQKYNLS